MARAFMAAGFHLNYIGPLKQSGVLFYKIKGRLLRMRGWDYSKDGEDRVLKSYARQVSRQLQHIKGKVILSCGKPHLAYLETSLPILFFDDASVPSLTRLYPGHTDLYPPTQRNLLAAERRVIEKCLYACYMSEWAAEAALAVYGSQFESKIKVIPIGANTERTPTEAEIEQFILNRIRNCCNLLFIGVDWKRKGGPIAVAVAEELRKRGIPVRLDIVGCKPPGLVPDFMRVHGYVSKQTDEGRRLIQRLYQESHFFLLPTQAEAYGIAFVEAAAHGLPSFGCRVGGVPTIVRDGENGWLFPPDAPAVAYADRIQTLFRTPDNYAVLCRSSFQAFQTRLSWKQFGDTVHTLVNQALG